MSKKVPNAEFLREKFFWHARRAEYMRLVDQKKVDILGILES